MSTSSSPWFARLQHCARLDVDDSAGRDIDALRRVAEVRHQGPGKDDERVLAAIAHDPGLRNRQGHP